MGNCITSLTDRSLSRGPPASLPASTSSSTVRVTSSAPQSAPQKISSQLSPSPLLFPFSPPSAPSPPLLEPSAIYSVSSSPSPPAPSPPTSFASSPPPLPSPPPPAPSPPPPVPSSSPSTSSTISLPRPTSPPVPSIPPLFSYPPFSLLDIPYDVPLPPHWRTHIVEVPLTTSTRWHESRYMQLNEYGNNVDAQINVLNNIIFHYQIQAAFPYFLTLFLDGTWTTRLRRTSFFAANGAGGGLPINNSEGDCVFDPYRRICRVTDIRFRGGTEQVYAIPLDGVASNSYSNYNNYNNPDLVNGVEEHAELVNGIGEDTVLVNGIVEGTAQVDGIREGTAIDDEQYWFSVDMVRRCMMP